VSYIIKKSKISQSRNDILLRCPEHLPWNYKKFQQGTQKEQIRTSNDSNYLASQHILRTSDMAWGRTSCCLHLTRVLPERLKFIVFIFIRSLFRDNIKVILLQESKIFSCFREFTFFHTFTNVPVDVCSLRVHHVVLL